MQVRCDPAKHKEATYLRSAKGKFSDCHGNKPKKEMPDYLGSFPRHPSFPFQSIDREHSSVYNLNQVNAAITA
jgi:hypothetical protein